jgi:DNA replication protein DnaC
MLNQPTMQGLTRLKLHAMATALAQQLGSPITQELSFEERFGMLVEAECQARENRRLTRILKQAHLKVQASLEDIDYGAPRGLKKPVIAGLSSCTWLRSGQNLLITGPTGVGKTWLACAFGHHAARRGYTVLYVRLPRLLEALDVVRASGGLPKLREQLAHTTLLILDDWAVAPMTDQGRQDLLEVIDDRAGTSALIITSQVPVSEWHAYLGEATIADAILDRVVHASHRLELKGESMRKLKAVGGVSETSADP